MQHIYLFRVGISEEKEAKPRLFLFLFFVFFNNVSSVGCVCLWRNLGSPGVLSSADVVYVGRGVPSVSTEGWGAILASLP